MEIRKHNHGATQSPQLLAFIGADGTFGWNRSAWTLILQIPDCHCTSRVTFPEISHALLHPLGAGEGGG